MVRLGLMVRNHRLGLHGFLRGAARIIFNQHPVAAILSFIIAVLDMFSSLDNWGTDSASGQSQECDIG